MGGGGPRKEEWGGALKGRIEGLRSEVRESSVEE
jgi:hypothetical protein